MDRRDGLREEAWIERAVRGGGETRSARLCAEHPAAEGGGHGAVVRAMRAAAGGQACVLGDFEHGRERAKTEEQDEQDGEHAPHPFMVQKVRSAVRQSGIIDAFPSSWAQTRIR